MIKQSTLLTVANLDAFRGDKEHKIYYSHYIIGVC